MAAIGIYSYESYMKAFEHWVSDGVTSSPGENVALANFTRLNLARTKRLEKTITLKPALVAKLSSLEHSYTWMVLTEAWCGDSAQNLPVIAAMAAVNPYRIRLLILLRNQHPDLMSQYLTNGTQSIPKVIGLNDTLGHEVFVWGPRPMPAQNMLMDWKRNPGGRSWDDFEKELHLWYAKDKSETLQNEWMELLKKLD